ncbi:MAG: diphosphomevalonate decarboxylase [Calditrichia bacterium]
MKAIAEAHPNIALVKYWGKRDQKLNLPAVGSISVTLDGLKTVSSVHFQPELKEDRLWINDKEASPQQTERVSRFLDLIRQKSGIKYRAEVQSHNNFPTGAGLASSASAFASLALAGSRAAGLNLNPSQLSELARLGSGSAARSIFGGFVEMKVGEKEDGSDAIAIKLEDKNYWNLRILIAITSEEEKKIGSTAGMQHTAKSSPFYHQWVLSSQLDLDMMRRAIFSRNFSQLGEIAEHNCLKMHAVAMSAKPALLYWNHTTLSVMHVIRQLREQGTLAYFTIDAGPQVKILCRPGDAEYLGKRILQIEGVQKVLVTSLGSDARLIEDEP